MGISTSLVALLVGLVGLCNLGIAAEVVPERAMVINGAIQGGNLGAVRSALLKVPADGEVDLVINSPGGSVVTGFDFVSVMEDAKSRGVVIRCYVAQMAASMAFQILLHCNERHVLDRSLLLWHRARVMLGGFGGAPMVSGQLAALATQLSKMDTLIFAECKQYISMSESTLAFHFESETLHVGKQLADETGSFESHEAIPGLYEALANPKLPRTESSNPFDDRRSETPVTPWRTDLEGFEFGEIIYIK